jgi:hypothetical protein
MNSEKDDVASPVAVLVYSHKDIGRYVLLGNILGVTAFESMLHLQME